MKRYKIFDETKLIESKHGPWVRFVDAQNEFFDLQLNNKEKDRQIVELKKRPTKELYDNARKKRDATIKKLCAELAVMRNFLLGAGRVPGTTRYRPSPITK